MMERHLFNSDAGTHYHPPEARTNLVMRLRCFIGIRFISENLAGSTKIANMSYKSRILILAA